MNELMLAQKQEIEECYKIIEMGRAFQKEQGFQQWTEDYPNLATLRQDVMEAKGYVIKVDGKIAGYMCIDFAGEPAYNNIEGAWRTAEPYAVVHRMAFSSAFRGMGLSGITFNLIEELCLANGVNSIRVDTDFANLRMQHVLEKLGFAKCGVIVFQGSGKVAYDKSF